MGVLQENPLPGFARPGRPRAAVPTWNGDAPCATALENAAAKLCPAGRVRAPAPIRAGMPIVLEQCCGAALPGLAFFFRDAFHVFHVGAGLGQHVVQVVADADEGEALLEELADPRGAE